ncbi:hypothetical protein KA005_71690 [bacterium]|nr:hypothetical protein [bacterium]
MTNAEAVKKVEDAIKESGQFVYKIDGVTPGTIPAEDETKVPDGEYMIVEERVAVPVN